MYETKRLRLRHWTDNDVESFILLTQDPVVMEFYPNICTRDQSIIVFKTFRNRFLQYGYPSYACELKFDKQFIGHVGFISRNDLPFSQCVEIGWRLFPKYWGQGFAAEAANKCLEIAFNGFNLPEIVSFTQLINKRSERIMQKIGMQRDLSGDFLHSNFAPENSLAQHILYRMSKSLRSNEKRFQ